MFVKPNFLFYIFENDNCFFDFGFQIIELLVDYVVVVEIAGSCVCQIWSVFFGFCTQGCNRFCVRAKGQEFLKRCVVAFRHACVFALKIFNGFVEEKDFCIKFLYIVVVFNAVENIFQLREQIVDIVDVRGSFVCLEDYVHKRRIIPWNRFYFVGRVKFFAFFVNRFCAFWLGAFHVLGNIRQISYIALALVVVFGIQWSACVFLPTPTPCKTACGRKNYSQNQDKEISACFVLPVG